MKATEAKLLDFLKKSPQFVIPIYQRTYSWTEKECMQLWDDIIRCGRDENIAVHFVGSIVYIEKADSNLSTWEPLLVIDGQQRLTTVTLLIAALAKGVGDTERMVFRRNFFAAITWSTHWRRGNENLNWSCPRRTRRR
jgi:hypothetical protein